MSALPLKAVLISRGIGREIAVELARAGAQTVIVSSSVDNLASAAKTIAAAGPSGADNGRQCRIQSQICRLDEWRLNERLTGNSALFVQISL